MVSFADRSKKEAENVNAYTFPSPLQLGQNSIFFAGLKKVRLPFFTL